jgi:hypothetical protein
LREKTRAPRDKEIGGKTKESAAEERTDVIGNLPDLFIAVAVSLLDSALDLLPASWFAEAI